MYSLKSVFYMFWGYAVNKKMATELPPPSLSEGSDRDLFIDSTLGELPLYDFSVEVDRLGVEVAAVFQKYPLLPGVILLEKGKYIGIISRRQLLEYLLLPEGIKLFLKKPLSVLYSYSRNHPLVLPHTTLILTAAQQTLRRSAERLGEPIIVHLDTENYRLLDMHQLNIAYWQIRGIETQVRHEKTQAQMIQTEKMATLGRLVDGVAHEILDPVGFIWGNLIHVENYSRDIMQLLSAYEQYLPTIPPEIQEIQEDIELNYIQQDLPRAIASIRSGADRLKKLVTGLQNFCHIDSVYPKPADIHSLLDSIILLLKTRISGEIEIVKNYGQLPPVTCYAAQLNQVFINIITNAIDALINEAVGLELAKEFGVNSAKNASHKPRIEITTQVISSDNHKYLTSHVRWASIRIADNGPGMSEAKQQQLLKTFSIEKRAVKETNLGLSYWIVTAKHEGKFKWNSRSGVGTEFEILLPLI